MTRRIPESTRERILATAMEEFARVGFAGARIDRIANSAQANKRMIYHYFGSKDGLRDAVFDEENKDFVKALDWYRLVRWRDLEQSDEQRTQLATQLKNRAQQLRELQEDGVLRKDVEADTVAALEFVAKNIDSLMPNELVAKQVSSESLIDTLSRLMRPRIRLQPRVMNRATN